jgi:hypothetical protein
MKVPGMPLALLILAELLVVQVSLPVSLQVPPLVYHHLLYQIIHRLSVSFLRIVSLF